MPNLLVDQPVVLSIDVQQDGAAVDGPIPRRPGYEQRLDRSVAIVEAGSTLRGDTGPRRPPVRPRLVVGAM